MIDRLFCYYGDDFTGSTDALEALASNGVSTVLFLDPPSDEMLARYPGCRAIGVAGESRSRNPQWMSEHLPVIFDRLLSLGAGICQYKICSTFDSSPSFGSIGRALEIGQDVFGTPSVPVVVAAPHLGRYVLFGNLFATGGDQVHRIDRHPTMSRHPVTPMDEADLRLHLSRQTARSIELFDILSLAGPYPEARFETLIAKQPAAILFDGLDEQTLRATGRLLWMCRSAEHSFAVGSSGLIYALVEYWRECSEIPATHTVVQPVPVDRLAVVSGSCSPVTANQIRWVAANGYFSIHLDVGASDDGASIRAALDAFGQGQSVVFYTALGSVDQDAQGGEKLGRRLGGLLRDVLISSGVRRAVVAGGDTSSHAVRQLGIESLTFAGLTAPGAPLCRCHGVGSLLDGLELVLKGGQVGPEDFFEMARMGKP